MTRGEFDPGAAVVAISKAIKKEKKGKSSLDWDKITRATYGLFPSVPMSTNYHDKEMDLATSFCNKDALLLQAAGDRIEKRDAEGVLWLLKPFGDSADKRKKIGKRSGILNACGTPVTSPSPGRPYF